MRTRRSRVAEAASRPVWRIRTAVASPVGSTAATKATAAATSTPQVALAAMPWSMPICSRYGPACSSSVSSRIASSAATSRPRSAERAAGRRVTRRAAVGDRVERRPRVAVVGLARLAAWRRPRPASAGMPANGSPLPVAARPPPIDGRPPPLNPPNPPPNMLIVDAPPRTSSGLARGEDLGVARLGRPAATRGCRRR